VRKVLLEAALNGPWTRWRQPAIPDTVVRARADVPVYPSIPSPGIGANAPALPAEQRFAHVEALAARGLL
jgi:hypothetical protein